jgi:Periplasmic lysozyme inhibitor of I-type lysozyme
MRKALSKITGLAALLALLASAHANADTVNARCDIYPKGQNRASAVMPCTFSQRQGYVAIDRADGVRHELSPKGDQPGAYVDERGRPAYRNKGLGSRGQIYRLADQSIYVYWDTAGLAAAKPAQAEPWGAPSKLPAVTAPSVPFDRTLTLQGISFRIRTPNDSSINTLELIPSGLETDTRPIARKIDGQVTGVEAADLNADGSPEIYVYVNSAGSGSYGSLVAYAANRKKSLSEIYLPPIADDKVLSQGYMGHDEFAVVESTFVRRFPIYRDGDMQAKPTGGMRQLQYKLVPGEAGWILKLDRKVEY